MVELRSASMLHKEPAAKVNLLQVNENATAVSAQEEAVPEKTVMAWDPNALDEDDPRRQAMEAKALKFGDSTASAEHQKHQEGYKDLMQRSEHFVQILKEPGFSVDGTIEHAKNSQHLSAELAKQAGNYASDLKSLMKGGQGLVNNLYSYHTQVDQRIRKAVDDSSLPDLQKELSEYYATKGAGSFVKPVGDHIRPDEEALRSHDQHLAGMQKGAYGSEVESAGGEKESAFGY